MIDIHSLSAFTCGFATAWFVIFACILLSKKGRTRLQTILGGSLCYWAFSTLKDLVLTQPSLYNMEVNTIILFLDGFSSITYVLVLFELAMPGWVTLKRIGYLALPFIGFFVANILFPSEILMNIYVAFLLIFGFTVWGMGYVKIRKYETYLRNNYSNLENMNLSWLNPIFVLIFVSEIQWLVISLMFTPIADAIYYLLSVAVWQITLHYTRDLKQVKPEEACRHIPPPITNSESKNYPFADIAEQVIVADGLYLNPTLSLNMLAAHLGTNRTYLSDYFNNVKGISFYDYINKLRIDKKSIPLITEHPEFTLEYVALQSGFNSLSTFRRAFKKYTGKTPGDFSKE